MSGSTGSPVVTQSQSKDPWSVAQPYLSNMYANAQNMFAGNVGYQPYTGQMQADIHPWAAEGLSDQYSIGQNMLNAGLPGVPEAQNAAAGIIAQQGITPGIQAGLGTIGQAGQQYANIYNQNIGQTNPYLLQAIADQNRLGAEKVQSAMSAAGRYGSGQMQDVIARAQAEVADPTLAQDYAQRMQLAQQATSGLAQTGQTAADIYNRGLGMAGTYSQLLPQLGQAQYATQMGGAQAIQAPGQFYTNYAQQALNNQIAQYNAQQAYPWQQLERESAILAGAGQLGGTTVTAQTPMQAPLAQRLLGGALVGGGLGSAIGGPFGAAGGAGLGALTGAFL